MFSSHGVWQKLTISWAWGNFFKSKDFNSCSQIHLITSSPPPTLKWYFLPRAQTFSVCLRYEFFCLLSNCHGNISCVHILVIWILGRCTYDMKLIISHLQTNVCTRHLVLHNTMYSITSFYTYATARFTWCLQSTEKSMA